MALWNSLRFRLVLLVLLAVGPALAITLFFGLEQRKLAREKAIGDAFHAVRLAARSQAVLMETTRQFLTALAFAPEIGSEVACEAYLSKLLAPANDAMSTAAQARVMVTSPDGQVYCTFGNDISFDDLSEQHFFQRILETRSLVIGRPLDGIEPGKTLLPIALPELDLGGNIRRVVVVMFDLTVAMQPVVATGLPPDSTLLLVDDVGTVLARFPGGETWIGKTLPDVPIVREILESRAEGSSELRGVDGVLRLYAFTPLNVSEDFRVYMAVGIPSATAFADADRILWQSMLGVGLASALAFLAAWIGGEVFFLRVVSLTAERDAAEQKLREANAALEMRVAERTADLQNTLGLLQRSNQDLQDFAHIASHDLQEPLRKIQAFGERLNQRYSNQLGEEGGMFIERMLASAVRMQHMINDLLAYSRVSTRPHAFQQVALKEVVDDVVSDLEVRIEETGGAVEVGELPVIEADPGQMRQV